MVAQGVQVQNPVMTFSPSFTLKNADSSNMACFDAFLVNSTAKDLFMSSNNANSKDVKLKSESGQFMSDDKSQTKMTASQSTERDKVCNVKTSAKDTKVSDTELAEKAAGFIEEVKQTLSDLLGISFDKLEQMMDEMHLSDADLLNTDNIKAMFLMLNDVDDPAEFITNGELFDSFKDMMNKISDLFEDNKEIVDLIKNSALTENNVLMKEDIGLIKDDEIEIKDYKGSRNDQLKGQKEDKTETGEKTVKTETISFRNMDKQSGLSKKNDDSHANMSDQRAEYFVNKLVQATENFTEMKIEGTYDIREIVTQVLDKVKLQVSEKTTSLEMQLTPEHLGKVSLTVSEENGTMKAKFVTESQISKEAIESNIAMFKETLREQGLKVDSIEVSVSNFEFNKDKETGNSEQEENSKGKKKKFVSEELDVKETTVENVYINNGLSTVDYVA